MYVPWVLFCFLFSAWPVICPTEIPEQRTIICIFRYSTWFFLKMCLPQNIFSSLFKFLHLIVFIYLFYGLQWMDLLSEVLSSCCFLYLWLLFMVNELFSCAFGHFLIVSLAFTGNPVWLRLWICSTKAVFHMFLPVTPRVERVLNNFFFISWLGEFQMKII